MTRKRKDAGSKERRASCAEVEGERRQRAGTRNLRHQDPRPKTRERRGRCWPSDRDQGKLPEMRETGQHSGGPRAMQGWRIEDPWKHPLLILEEWAMLQGCKGCGWWRGRRRLDRCFDRRAGPLRAVRPVSTLSRLISRDESAFFRHELVYMRLLECRIRPLCCWICYGAMISSPL